MGGTSKLALALALAAMAIGLSACGGGDDSTQSSSSTATTTQEATETTPAEGASAEGEQESGDDDALSKDSGEASSGDDSSSSSSEEGSASFRTRGGDNSIQNFGEEADAAEVDAANAVLSGYLQTRAKDDWAGECTFLAEAAVAPLEQLASSSPQLKGKGCAAILAALSARTPTSLRASTMTTGIASLRVEGDRGFALYHGAKGVNYFVPMVKEDGKWKVGALAPSEFP